MRTLLLITSLGLLLGGCAVFQKTPQYEIGMEEEVFLKMHNEAVISKLEDQQKTYRVVRDDRFYMLATFEGGKLIKLEEKELPRYWNHNNDQDSQKTQ